MNMETNSTGTFFCDIFDEPAAKKIIEKVKKFSMNHELQAYIIKQPLGEKSKYTYSYNNVAIVLIPGYKINVVNYGQECEEFEDYEEDLIEDIGHLSDRFEYKKILGRPREWKRLIKFWQIKDFVGKELNIESVRDQESRKVELLISLLIGSINDIEQVGIAYPETLLDKVKHKIILFDGMQSRFIYEPVDEKVVRIQGLAGTGKTELLLHKLRKNYIEVKDSKIAFTCYNKILAEDMKKRIPQFFNFMKVDEQIEWWSRLCVFPSWGSKNNPISGMYSYICNNYNLKFQRYSSESTFDKVCLYAIEQLKQREEIEPCFDYVYIDESQDFPQSFFTLCTLVTRNQVFIAGDIFQNVFDLNIRPDVNCHYLLNKCYRTDPHTLMLAHSIGMGLFEHPIIRWLEDDEWKACGYAIERIDGQVKLEREKIRRFDIDDADVQKSIQIKACTDYISEVQNCVDSIIGENPTVKADDIAVVFLSNCRLNYQLADELAYLFRENYHWKACQGYVTKEKMKDCVFISNVNNIKGLEFPFVICVCTGRITQSIKQRNSIYMVLTRSFLNSYLLINSENDEFIRDYQNAAESIASNGYIQVLEPTDEEKLQQSEKISIEIADVGKSVEDIIEEVCNEYKLPIDKRLQVNNVVQAIMEDAFDEETIKEKTSGAIKLVMGIK